VTAIKNHLSVEVFLEQVKEEDPGVTG